METVVEQTLLRISHNTTDVQGTFTIKVLGLRRNSKEDYFFFTVITLNKHSRHVIEAGPHL